MIAVELFNVHFAVVVCIRYKINDGVTNIGILCCRKKNGINEKNLSVLWPRTIVK